MLLEVLIVYLELLPFTWKHFDDYKILVLEKNTWNYSPECRLVIPGKYAPYQYKYLDF